MEVRFAREDELVQVNRLRKQVNDLHVKGEPEIFKPGFSTEWQKYIYEICNDPHKRIVVCENSGKVCAYAVLNHIVSPENPCLYERNYLDIDELCVDEAFRRQGLATDMISFIRDFAKYEGVKRIEQTDAVLTGIGERRLFALEDWKQCQFHGKMKLTK